MSEILKIFVDLMIIDRPTWWVILDCGHWYHWTGAKPPEGEELDCPHCNQATVAVRQEKP